jgi:hypothetical protein
MAAREVERSRNSREEEHPRPVFQPFADELEIAVVGSSSRYRGHPATTRDDVPYQLIVEYGD